MAKRPVQQKLFDDMARKQLAFQAMEFERIFGVKLIGFWLGPRLRLDVTLLDREIVKSGGTPMADVVEERYGKEAVDLIHALL